MLHNKQTRDRVKKFKILLSCPNLFFTVVDSFDSCQYSIVITSLDVTCFKKDCRQLAKMVNKCETKKCLCLERIMH